MAKRAIPSVPATAQAQGRALFDASIKENLERITGLRSGQLPLLRLDATNYDIIVKINELIERLQ